MSPYPPVDPALTCCPHAPSEHGPNGCLDGWGDATRPEGGCSCLVRGPKAVTTALAERLADPLGMRVEDAVVQMRTERGDPDPWAHLHWADQQNRLRRHRAQPAEAAPTREGGVGHYPAITPQRFRAEVYARRAIVEFWVGIHDQSEPRIGEDTPEARELHAMQSGLYGAVLAVAQPFAGHPDFDAAWNLEEQT